MGLNPIHSALADHIELRLQGRPFLASAARRVCRVDADGYPFVYNAHRNEVARALEILIADGRATKHFGIIYYIPWQPDNNPAWT